MEELPECSLCNNYYGELVLRVPRILTACGHTVCEECAQRLLENANITCPFDRKQTRTADVKSLPKNYSLLQMATELTTKKQEEDVECGVASECGEDPTHVATLYCVKCDVDLCEDCWQTIHSPRVLSSHERCPIGKKGFQFPKCPEHCHNLADMVCEAPFCVAASKLMCHTCALHGPHTGHKTNLLRTKCDELTKTLKSLMRLLNDTGKSADELRDYITSISRGEKSEAAARNIETSFTGFKESCEETMRTAMSDLHWEIMGRVSYVNELVEKCEEAEQNPQRLELQTRIERLIKMKKSRLIDWVLEINCLKERVEKMDLKKNHFDPEKCHLKIPQFKMILYRFIGDLYIDTRYSGDSEWIEQVIRKVSTEIEKNELLFEKRGFRLVKSINEVLPEERRTGMRAIYFCDFPSVPLCIETLETQPRVMQADRVVLCVTAFESSQDTVAVANYQTQLNDFKSKSVETREIITLKKKEDIGLVLTEALSM